MRLSALLLVLPAVFVTAVSASGTSALPQTEQCVASWNRNASTKQHAEVAKTRLALVVASAAVRRIVVNRPHRAVVTFPAGCAISFGDDQFRIGTEGSATSGIVKRWDSLHALQGSQGFRWNAVVRSNGTIQLRS